MSPPNPVLSDRLASGAGGALWGGGGPSEGPPAQHTGWPLANSPVSIPVSRTSEPGGGGAASFTPCPPQGGGG